MTMTAISHIRAAVRPLVTHALSAPFVGPRRDWRGSVARRMPAVGFRPCYKTSIDDANRIG